MTRLNLLAAIVLLLLSSCQPKTYFQICKVSSPLETNSEGFYSFNNSQIDIKYNFWSEGGIFEFIITNISNEIITVDLSKSFFIKNGLAFDYYLNRTTKYSSSVSSSQSSSISRTIFGTYNKFGKKIPGSMSQSFSDNLGSHNSKSISFGEKMSLIIPPHSSKIIAEYSIMKKHYRDCDLYESPSKDEESFLTFTQDNSPASIVNYLTYTIGNNPIEQIIKNEFYISQISNQNYDATKIQVKIGCESDWSMEKIEDFKNSAPNEFYIEYTPVSQNKDKTNVTKNGKRVHQKSFNRPENVADPIYDRTPIKKD